MEKEIQKLKIVVSVYTILFGILIGVLCLTVSNTYKDTKNILEIVGSNTIMLESIDYSINTKECK